MIAVNIGKTFLRAYNHKYDKNYSAKEFFEQEFFPLFYNHPKYMQWVTNSPFVQGLRKGKYPTEDERVQKLDRLKDKISSLSPDASIAIGFPSLDLVATTSGQITNLDLGIKEEDVYASWIGGGFGIGVQGGLVIFFDLPEILLKLYDGWQIYRNELQEKPKLRPNQIDTWNGQWLSHVYNKRYYVEASPTANFNPLETKKDGTVQVATQKWVKVLAGIAQHFSEQRITGYIFNLGQTNTTIGFIPFSLPSITKPIEYYKRLFGENDYLQNARLIEDLLGSELTLYSSCKRGQIGINAMQPKGLMPFIRMHRSEMKLPEYRKKPILKPKNNESVEEFDDRKKKSLDKYNNHIVTYKTYEGWLMATLNDESLYEKAEKYAQCFIEYQKGAGKGKKDRINHVKQALKAKNRHFFIEELVTIIENEKLEPINELVKEIVKMPGDNFPYFLTLIRFRYAYLNQ